MLWRGTGHDPSGEVEERRAYLERCRGVDGLPQLCENEVRAINSEAVLAIEQPRGSRLADLPGLSPEVGLAVAADVARLAMVASALTGLDWRMMVDCVWVDRDARVTLFDVPEFDGHALATCRPEDWRGDLVSLLGELASQTDRPEIRAAYLDAMVSVRRHASTLGEAVGILQRAAGQYVDTPEMVPKRRAFTAGMAGVLFVTLLSIIGDLVPHPSATLPAAAGCVEMSARWVESEVVPAGVEAEQAVTERRARSRRSPRGRRRAVTRSSMVPPPRPTPVADLLAARI